MKSVDWRQIHWSSVLLYAIYVWILGLGVAFVGYQLGLDQWQDFTPALMLFVALAVFWASNRVALTASQQPIAHGLLVGLIVGMTGLVLALVTSGLGVTEVAACLLQILGGLLGGRVAQRMQERKR
jgi:hypothetical protein